MGSQVRQYSLRTQICYDDGSILFCKVLSVTILFKYNSKAIFSPGWQGTKRLNMTRSFEVLYTIISVMPVGSLLFVFVTVWLLGFVQLCILANFPVGKSDYRRYNGIYIMCVGTISVVKKFKFETDVANFMNLKTRQIALFGVFLLGVGSCTWKIGIYIEHLNKYVNQLLRQHIRCSMFILWGQKRPDTVGSCIYSVQFQRITIVMYPNETWNATRYYNTHYALQIHWVRRFAAMFFLLFVLIHLKYIAFFSH